MSSVLVISQTLMMDSRLIDDPRRTEDSRLMERRPRDWRGLRRLVSMVDDLNREIEVVLETWYEVVRRLISEVVFLI